MAGIKADKEMMAKGELDSLLKENGETQPKPVWKDRMFALIILMLVNIVFWACFEQAGTSLTLFADRNVDRLIFGWEMPASMTQFFNPAFHCNLWLNFLSNVVKAFQNWKKTQVFQ